MNGSKNIAGLYIFILHENRRRYTCVICYPAEHTTDAWYGQYSWHPGLCESKFLLQEIQRKVSTKE